VARRDGVASVLTASGQVCGSSVNGASGRAAEQRGARARRRNGEGTLHGAHAPGDKDTVAWGSGDDRRLRALRREHGDQVGGGRRGSGDWGTRLKPVWATDWWARPSYKYPF
jgi:hypothetical protein